MALEGRPRGSALRTRAPRQRAAWFSHERSGRDRRLVRHSTESERRMPSLQRGGILAREHRHEIVFADALQDQEGERGRAAIGD